jgi:hypothetical protein
MENPAFNVVSLYDVRVIMVIMRVLMVEMPCQVMTGRILALKCLLPGARGRLWSCLALSDIKWPHCSRIPAPGSLARDGDRW